VLCVRWQIVILADAALAGRALSAMPQATTAVTMATPSRRGRTTHRANAPTVLPILAASATDCRPA